MAKISGKNPKKALGKEAFKSSIWNFTATFISRLGGFFFTIILARFMMPELFGIYNISISIALILLTLTDLGINSALIKYFSQEIKNNKKKAAAYSKYLFRFKLLLTLIISTLLIVFSYTLSYFIFKKSLLFIPLIISGFYIFVYSIEGFLQSFFYTIQKVNYISIKEILGQTFRIVGVLIIFLFVPTSYYVTGSILILIVTSILASSFFFINLRRIIPFIFNPSNIKIDKSKIKKFVFWLSIANISVIFFSYIDVLMIGYFIEQAAYAGFYRAAFALVSGIAGLLTVVAVLLPILTQLNGSRLKNAFNRVLRYLWILSMPMAFGLAVISNFITVFLYGANYLPASLPLFFLSFLIVGLVVEGLLLSFYSSQEKPKIYAKTVIFSTILNILLNYILITQLLKFSPELAITGAAIATLISRYVHLFILFFFLKKDFKISPKFLDWFKPLIASIIMFFSIQQIINYIQDMDIFYGLLIIITGILIYCVVMLVLGGINKQDLELIKLIR